MENATYAAKKITSFVSFIGEDQSREVLDRAKESRAENKDGIKGWMVTQHADWLDHPSQEQEKGMDFIEFGVGENGVMSTKTEDLTRAIERFRVAHPIFEITLDEIVNSIKVGSSSIPIYHMLTNEDLYTSTRQPSLSD